MFRSDLIQEQQNDPTLIEMFQQVRPVEEMESVAHILPGRGHVGEKMAASR